MAPHPTLHAGFERLIGTAATDKAFNSALLRNPRAAALEFGLTLHDADIVSDIHARDLRTFASVLLPRLYGRDNSIGSVSAAVAG